MNEKYESFGEQICSIVRCKRHRFFSFLSFLHNDNEFVAALWTRKNVQEVLVLPLEPRAHVSRRENGKENTISTDLVRDFLRRRIKRAHRARSDRIETSISTPRRRHRFFSSSSSSLTFRATSVSSCSSAPLRCYLPTWIVSSKTLRRAPNR